MKVELETTQTVSKTFSMKLDPAKIMEMLDLIYGGMPEDAKVLFHDENAGNEFELGKGQYILVEWAEKSATSETSTFAGRAPHEDIVT